MKKRIYRVSTNLLVALAVVICGALVGYGVGVRATLNGAARWLRTYAVERDARTDRFPDEGMSVLRTMNASVYPRCSEAELASFRHLLMASEFLKDAGRMRGDQLECSASLSRSDLPETKYTPAFNGPDRSLLYNDIRALRVGPFLPIVLRLGDAYVSLDPYPRDAALTTTKVALTMKNVPPGQSAFLGGDRYRIPYDLLTHNVDGRLRGSLFATQCSEHNPTCLTAYIGVHEVLLEQRRQVTIWVCLGGLIGLCVALGGMLLYKRTKGIEHQLRRAIRKEALRVVYQPLFDMTTRELVGAEALVRWTDEDGLAIPPPVSIQIAEDKGFVARITRLVVRHIVADFGDYLKYHPEFRINLNVTASDLTDPEFFPMFEESLAAASVPAECLRVEITEGATARHEAAMRAICQLRRRGHSVYIDDFGTGYSSLAYLKDLSVDGIKIDKAFTCSVGTEAVTLSILPQILAMAEALNLGVVAEGIETEAQYEYYRRTGMPLIAQGWLFGYAVPPEEFRERWLSSVEEPLTSVAV